MSDRDSLYRYASQEWCAGTELQDVLIRVANALGEKDKRIAELEEIEQAARELLKQQTDSGQIIVDADFGLNWVVMDLK